MSWTGLPEFADDTITNYSRPSPSIESNTSDLQNSNSSVFEHEESLESIMSKPMIKFVKEADSPTIKKEKEGLDRKLTGFASASKDLDTLLGNQRTNKNKEGLGYSDVPPLFLLKPSPSIESNTSDLQNSNSSASEHRESPESVMSKSMLKFVKTADSPTDKEIDKLMALISLSFKKIYKPTNNNLRTSSNTSRANQDNSPKINRSAGYENQRIGNVARARENVEQADWRDGTDDDELEDQELEAHYMYMAQLQENDDDNDLAKEPRDSDEVIHLEKESRSKLSDLIRPFDYDKPNNLEYYYVDHMYEILGVYTELDEITNMQCDYLELLEKCKGLETELSKSKMMSKSFESVQKHAINLELDEGLETEISKSKMMSKSFESVQKHAINLELELQHCKEKIKNDMLFKVNKTKDFCKEREQYFEIHDLKAQLQDKGIVISELKKFIEKLKGKSVDTKFEKSSVIRQPNAFKSQRPSVFGKLTTFSNSFVRKDFSKSMSVTQTYVSNDFSKPVTAQTLPTNKKSILKNTNVLATGMYKLHTDHTQTRTSQLPQDSRKTNKRVSFYTGVVLTTSVSRPQLKSNLQGDRVMHNNSQGKKQAVEDHHRSVKLSKNKTSVTAYLKVAFRKSTCFIRDLKGNDLLTGSHRTDLYSITLQDTNCPNPICLMVKVTSSQAWLWHRHLTHLNFNTINLLSKNDIVAGLPKLNFVKDHLCSSCELRKAKRKGLHAQVRVVRTDKGTEFLSQALHAYFAAEGIRHQTSIARTPEQNGIVERWNRTLVEAARTMLSAAKVPLFFWAEAIVTACFIQNRSLVIPHHEKTPYHIINDRKSNSNPAPECQTMALNHDSLSPVIQRHKNVPQVDMIVTTSNELDLLFSLMLMNYSTDLLRLCLSLPLYLLLMLQINFNITQVH
nr:integrase, catalytic region, zinc finger, CCHC-type, peptidase aspartic, catalytic [Tanacetum cinerariifolium]